jgi:uncharacterized protein (TIGR02452 family)
MKKTTRILHARQTTEIAQRGFYTTPSGRIVDVAADIEAAKRGTRIYDSLFPSLGALLHPLPDARLETTNESTFAALRRLRDEGEPAIGCLNFASAKNPGGGFLNGAEAQEEALSRASALYDCLLCAPDYYERNRANRSCLYLDMVIASPRVPLFRDDDGELLDQPMLASIITAPAPNAGAVTRNEPSRAPEIESALRRRAELVLYAAAREGIESLVLGAWGCGVFRNDPRLVAMTFANLLKPSRPYAALFKRIIFAVFDPAGGGANYRAFREEFA